MQPEISPGVNMSNGQELTYPVLTLGHPALGDSSLMRIYGQPGKFSWAGGWVMDHGSWAFSLLRGQVCLVLLLGKRTSSASMNQSMAVLRLLPTPQNTAGTNIPRELVTAAPPQDLPLTGVSILCCESLGSETRNEAGE